MSVNLKLSEHNDVHAMKLSPKSHLDLKEGTVPIMDASSSSMGSKKVIHSEEVPVVGTTPFQTFLHLFKGNVGPGCLSLPWAFSILGIPLGCITTILVTVVVTFNAWTLVRLKRKYLHGKKSATYSDVGEAAYGPGFRPVVDMSVITLQLSVCTIFFSNMAVNMSSIVRKIFGTYTIHNHTINESIHNNSLGTDHDQNSLLQFFSSQRVLMTVFLLPACLGLSSLSNLKTLAPYIALASVLMFSTFFLISVVICRHWEEGFSTWMNNGGISIEWAKVPIATCAIMYSLEGDQLILPIESSMTDPIRYFQPILLFSMTFICCVFCVFGSCCVIAFGHVGNGSVTAFLLDHAVDWKNASTSWSPTSSQIVFTANVIVSLSLVFTYPLQLFPAFGLTGQIISKFIKRKTTTDEEWTKLHETKTLDFIHCENSTEHSSSHYGSIESPIEELNDELEKYSATNDQESDTVQKNFHGHSENDGMKIECDSLKMRFSLVFLTYLVAMVVPHLELLIALAGAITGSATSLIVPPLIALKFEIMEAMSDTSQSSTKPEKRSKLCILRKSSNIYWIILFVFIIFVGLIYGIIGTWYSIKDLMETLS